MTVPRRLRSVDDEQTVPRISRLQFLEKFSKEYQPGQHVTIIGPTQRGKTTLCHQMIMAVVSHEGPTAVIFAGKPPTRDPVMGKAAKRMNMRTVKEWPPGPYAKAMSKYHKQNGYVLRPEHDMSNPETTDKHLHNEFKTALIHSYQSKIPVIVVVDEGAHVSDNLKLKPYMDSILMRGAPVVALWVLVQRGRYMSYHIYDQPEWFLLAYDPDVSNQRRYADIGGVDPTKVMELQSQLKTRRVETGGTISEFLCIRRSGPEIFIVDTE